MFEGKGERDIQGLALAFFCARGRSRCQPWLQKGDDVRGKAARGCGVSLVAVLFECQVFCCFFCCLVYFFFAVVFVFLLCRSIDSSSAWRSLFVLLVFDLFCAIKKKIILCARCKKGEQSEDNDKKTHTAHKGKIDN